MDKPNIIANADLWRKNSLDSRPHSLLRPRVKDRKATPITEYVEHTPTCPLRLVDDRTMHISRYVFGVYLHVDLDL